MYNNTPKGYTPVTPYLLVDNVIEALAFYAKTLGAVEDYRLTLPNGHVPHAQFSIGAAKLMIGTPMADWKGKSVQEMRGSPVSFFVYVDDVEAAFAKAKQAGMTQKFPIEEKFWGDRMGTLNDPFGYEWSLAQFVREVSQAEMQEAISKMSG